MIHKIGPRPKVVKDLFNEMKLCAAINEAYYPEIIEATHMLTMYVINEMGQTIDKYEPCSICPPDKKRRRPKNDPKSSDI